MALIDRILDPEQPPLVVAELSGNHAQSFDTAKALVAAAAQAGADAVKLQTYTPDSITLDCDRPEFTVQGGLWHGRRLHELYAQACTPYDWHAPLADYARQLGIPLFSAPFDEHAVDFLEQAIQPELHKIASFELTHHPLLKKVAQTGKPIVLSSGMATAPEIDEALAVLRQNGAPEIILLKCVSAYPSQPEGFNLRSLQTLAARYGCPVGLSDHTLTNEVALAAVALGARLVEKHLCLSREGPGIDAGFSLEPPELASLVEQTRRVHAALGSRELSPTDQDAQQTHFRRSIYAAQDIQAGQAFTRQNLRVVRPSLGLPPKHWDSLIGRPAPRDLPRGAPLGPQDLPPA